MNDMTAHPLAHPFDFAACFASDYADARARFLAAIGAIDAQAKSYANPGRGPQGEALTTDVAWIGPARARRVLVLQSATHGVEGFTGSAAMLDFLRAGGARALPDDVAVQIESWRAFQGATKLQLKQAPEPLAPRRNQQS